MLIKLNFSFDFVAKTPKIFSARRPKIVMYNTQLLSNFKHLVNLNVGLGILYCHGSNKVFDNAHTDT